MLKPRDIEDDPKTMLEKAKRDHLRATILLKEIRKTIPKDLIIVYSFGIWSESLTFYIFPNGKVKFSADETRSLLLWTTETYEKPKRCISEGGEIYYYVEFKIKVNQEEVNCDVIINRSHPLNCQIIPVKKEITVYEAVCSDD